MGEIPELPGDEAKEMVRAPIQRTFCAMLRAWAFHAVTQPLTVWSREIFQCAL